MGGSEWSWVCRWRSTCPHFQKSQTEGAADQAMCVSPLVLHLRDLFLLIFSLTIGLMLLCQATPPEAGCSSLCGANYCNDTTPPPSTFSSAQLSPGNAGPTLDHPAREWEQKSIDTKCSHPIAPHTCQDSRQHPFSPHSFKCW